MKKNRKLTIVYEDKDLIVINKPSHLLTISTDREKEKTLYHEVLLYEKKKNKNNKVFIVHRLDRDTCGLIVFAKSELIKRKLQNDWDKTKRGYVCLVNGVLPQKKGTIKSYLKETKTLLVYSTSDKDGELAITNYESLMTNNKVSLVKIIIKTGKKHQIRVHMNDLGNSIVGDKKYGHLKYDPLRKLCLCANYLEFNHPINNKKLIFKLDIPKDYLLLMDK